MISDSRPRRQHGWLLIEVLVTVLISAAMLSSLVSFQISLYQETRQAARHAAALDIAVTRLETLRSRIRAEVTTPENGSGTVETLGMPFAIHWDIQIAEPGTRLKQIDVKVKWQEPDDTADSVRLVARIEQAGALVAGFTDGNRLY